jgi:anti-sigma factor RsiW
VDPVRIDPCGHHIDELLHKKADARLSGEEAAALERQTAACAACRERAALLDWAVDGLRREQRALPAGLSDEVMRRIRSLEPSRPLRAPSRQALVLRWLPAAAVLAVGIGALALYESGRRPSADGASRIQVETSSRVQVELQLARVEARSVAIAGDFNGWDAVTMKKGEDGVFRVQLSLVPGRYQYAFLVDEHVWVPDPRAATVVDSGYGGADSVLDLTL